MNMWGHESSPNSLRVSWLALIRVRDTPAISSDVMKDPDITLVTTTPRFSVNRKDDQLHSSELHWKGVKGSKCDFSAGPRLIINVILMAVNTQTLTDKLIHTHTNTLLTQTVHSCPSNHRHLQTGQSSQVVHTQNHTVSCKKEIQIHFSSNK